MIVWEITPPPIQGRGTYPDPFRRSFSHPCRHGGVSHGPGHGQPGRNPFSMSGSLGIHRLFQHRERIESATVLIVVCQREGALPSRRGRGW